MAYFAAFHETKKQLPPASSQLQKICGDLGGGFVAGCSAATVNNPFDVVKTRMQVGAASGVSSHAVAQEFGASRTSMLGGMCNLVRTEGWLSLYKGYIAKVARLGPGSAIIFCVYEQLMAFF